jgi:dTDP-glucose 4,6-dehydratase
MNILVTGGCGFIGSNFVRQLLLEPAAGPARIVNLDKLTYAGNPANLSDVAGDPRYTFVHGDIGDEALVSGLLAKHGIGRRQPRRREPRRPLDRLPEPFIQTNVVGTLRLLGAAKRHWAGLQGAAKDSFSFLHVSTDEVYGTLGPRDPAFTEETPSRPTLPMPPPRPRATTWCAPTTTRTACPP